MRTGRYSLLCIIPEHALSLYEVQISERIECHISPTSGQIRASHSFTARLWNINHTGALQRHFRIRKLVGYSLPAWS